MKSHHLLLTLIFTLPLQANWLNWRGPTSDNIAPAGQNPPLEWTQEKNVLWKTPVPGRGHSSPIIIGDKLFLTTADEDKKTQSVLAFDRTTGKLLWNQIVLTDLFPKKIHKKNTHASPTSASDGKNLYSAFLADQKIHLIAHDLEGKELWRKNAGTFISKTYKFGFGSSPLIYKDTIILCIDSDVDPALVAFHAQTGKEKWRTPRPKVSISYSTPVLGTVSGQETIITSGNSAVIGYHPDTGKELWNVPSGPKVTANTCVTDGTLVYSSGGFPTKETWAVDPKKGTVVWTTKVKCYEQSLLLVNGHLYGIAEKGWAYCWKADTGERLWKTRLAIGDECSSPMFAGGHIYHSNERGQTFVFKPNPEKLELIHTNKLDDEIFATPAILDNTIYLRTAKNENENRQEYLYALGKK